MPTKKNGSSKKTSDDNPSAQTTPGKSSPEKLSDQNRYEDYDEERGSYNPAHESDYDVDENDIDQRSNEYKNHGGRNSEKNPEGP